MLILRLIFLIVYYWSSKIMVNPQSIQMVTLGRSFHLGMLYDIRSDKIITGATLWDQQNLADHTSTNKQPYTNYEIIAEDSLQKKAHALGVEASLKLSLLGGLISVSGSAKYAEDYQKTNHATRLTLKYSTTTHVEQLSLKDLGEYYLNHSELHDADLATHVVTDVVYGAEAFFVFDRTVSNGESKKEISSKLKMMIDKIPKFSIDGETKLNLTDKEKNLIDKLNCTFYGDFRLSENPSTFTEAVRIYRRLPLLVGGNNANAIPKKVSLSPLYLLDNKATRTVREISSKLIDYSISVIENLYSLEVRALDLSKSAMFAHFNHMKKHLLDFIERLSEVQQDLKEKIALYLPKLRGNTGIDESVLFNLFKQIDSSSFNRRKLESWLKEKEKEIELVTSWIGILAKDKRLNIMNESLPLNEVIDDTRYNYIMCLSFRFVEENDQQLTDMYNYQYDKTNFNSSKIRQKHTKWFEDRRHIAKIRKNIQKFIQFAKANNVKNGKIKFIVDEEYSVDHVKNVELVLYDDGSEEEGFIIPSKPDTPYAKNVTDNNITLEWTDAAHGSEKVKKYKVMYRKYNGENENENEENWTEVYTKSNQKELIISNLPSNTTFVFKVQSITAIGLSPISDISEPIDTLTTKKPIEMPTTKESIETSTKIESIDTSTKKKPEYGGKIAPSSININTKWKQNGITIAGGNGYGNQSNQLIAPYGIYVDDKKQSIYIADRLNHRIVEWKWNAKDGQVVRGENGQEDRMNQLNDLTNVIVDEKNNSLIICDRWNRRVVRWSRQNHTNGETIISDIDCLGLTMDTSENLYVSDWKKNEVRRWQKGDKNGIIVAGGNGNGSNLNQLYQPHYLFVDENHSVYVSDNANHRVMKWMKDAKQGIIVAGGQGEGNSLSQLDGPGGVFVDQSENVYVADTWNDRLMRWSKGYKDGSIIIGGNGNRNEPNQLNFPEGLSFDQQGNLYVADYYNHRVQKFLID